MNKYWIYNKIIKCVCNKYVASTIIQYCIGKYVSKNIMYLYTVHKILQ